MSEAGGPQENIEKRRVTHEKVAKLRNRSSGSPLDDVAGNDSGCVRPPGKPIVIGYVGNVASPGTKPCMDIQK